MACLFSADTLKAAEDDLPVVYLLHGLGRTRLSMVPLQWHLKGLGYQVENWGFCSYTRRVGEIGERLFQEIETAHHQTQKQIALIGFSTGGAVVRWVLANKAPGFVKRSILIASPIQGFIKPGSFFHFLRYIFPPIKDFGAEKESTLNQSPQIRNTEVGVIQGMNDLVVPVFASHLNEAADLKQSPYGHSTTLYAPQTFKDVEQFLKTGRF